MNSPNHIYSVSELNKTLREMLEGTFPFISVEGEISNLRTPYSGHCYFVLKDNSAQIKTVLFKMQKRYLSEPLADGKRVVCRGRLSIYEARGDYQLIVDTVSFQGSGNLQLAFEQLKRKLAEEGLFDAERKKTIPTSPEHITLITSPQGAAVHDFIQIATRRSPGIHLLVYPVSVQGQQAPGEIIEALQAVNEHAQTDIIVLCRGGGSLEDLWAFNDEQLTRAICASNIPVVSAVGHEIDFTLADFAADLRAPTPSGAAELLVPDTLSLHRQLNHLAQKIEACITRQVQEYQHRLRYCCQQLSKMKYPIERNLLRLGQLNLQLERSMETMLTARERSIQERANQIQQHSPVAQLRLKEQQIKHEHKRLEQAIQVLLSRKEQAMTHLVGLLDGVSPLATLARGYSIVQKNTSPHPVVTDASQVHVGERLHIRFHKGAVQATVATREQE